MMKKPFREERREYIRLKYVFPVEIFLSDKSKVIQAFTRDIGMGGISVSVNDPPKELLDALKKSTTRMAVHINLPLFNEPTQAVVRAVWNRKQKKGRYDRLIIGLGYQEISINEKRRLVRIALRLKWIPRVAVSFIIFLAALLIFSQYQVIEVSNKNKALVRDFHNSQSMVEAYKKSSGKLEKEYEIVKEKIINVEKKSKEVEEKLIIPEVPGEAVETLAKEKEELEKQLNIIL